MSKSLAVLILLIAALAYSDCRPRLHAAPASSTPAIQGRTWILSEAVDANGVRMAILLDKSGRPLALTFGPEEIAVLNACNHIGARYNLRSRGRIRIEQAFSTLMACPETDLMDAERVIAAWLPKASTLHVHDNRLELKAADGSRLLFVTR